MTNFEKIKNMSMKELAYKISWVITDCDICPIREFCNYEIQKSQTAVWSGYND